MPLREVDHQDVAVVNAFLASLTEEERTFFWDDVSDPVIVERWLNDAQRRPMVAEEEDGTIAAFASLVPQHEWSSHVAELVLVVASAARRRGHGRALAQAMLVNALQSGFTKVSVDVSADRPGAIAMFQGIGFQAEALLRDHLRTPETGELHDLVILSHLVEETYAHMLSAGMDTVTS